jgi:predicted esterase
MTEKIVRFAFNARYYKLGEILPGTKQVWFVLHGYGQLAQFFIRKFKPLERHGICVIAPEGLSRFYLEQLDTTGRKSNRVGATWMTRENREMDIENYLQYLSTIYDEEIKDASVEVTILGFSQGSATASRWALSGRSKFARLILWAGIFPPDMNFEAGSKILKDKDVLMVYGTKDPFLTDERFTEMRTLTKKINAKVKEVRFEGEHDIDEATLISLLE